MHDYFMLLFIKYYINYQFETWRSIIKSYTAWSLLDEVYKFKVQSKTDISYNINDTKPRKYFGIFTG